MTTAQTAPVRGPARRRGAGALVALAVLGLLVAGCSAGDSGGSSAELRDQGGAALGDGAPPEGAAAPADAAAGDEQAATSAQGAASADRMVVKNGELYLTVDDPVAAAGEVVDVVERLGGRVDQREQRAESDGQAGAATLTVRVPAASLDEAVDRLGELGDVSRYSEATKDVTDTVVDLDARIGAAEASVDRVREFLERAANTTELLATERELSQRQGELESLRGQRAALADQVAMSTLYVSLTAPGDPVVEQPGPKTFVQGLGAGWRSLWATLRAIAVALGVLLPWLAVTAVVVVAVALPLRRRRGRGTPPLAGPPAFPWTPAPGAGMPPAGVPAPAAGVPAPPVGAVPPPAAPPAGATPPPAAPPAGPAAGA